MLWIGGEGMLKLDDIHMMLAIKKYGSINKAAESLFVSQPYLSKRVAQLEGLLGVPLLIRSKVGVSLTEAGQEFCVHSETIKEAIDQINGINNRFAKKMEPGVQIPAHGPYVVNDFTNALQVMATLSDISGSLKLITFFAYAIVDAFDGQMRRGKLDGYTSEYEEVPNYQVPKILMGLSDEEVNNTTIAGMVYFAAKQGDCTLHESLRALMEKGWQAMVCTRLKPCALMSTSHPLYQKAAAQNGQLNFLDLQTYKLLIEAPKFDANSAMYHYFEGFEVEHTQFENSRSLQYFLTKHTDDYTMGQGFYNESNPLVTAGSLAYVSLYDAPFDLVTMIVTKNSDKKTAHF